MHNIVYVVIPDAKIAGDTSKEHIDATDIEGREIKTPIIPGKGVVTNSRDTAEKIAEVCSIEELISLLNMLLAGDDNSVAADFVNQLGEDIKADISDINQVSKIKLQKRWEAH